MVQQLWSYDLYISVNDGSLFEPSCASHNKYEGFKGKLKTFKYIYIAIKTSDTIFDANNNFKNKGIPKKRGIYVFNCYECRTVYLDETDH